MRDETFTTHLSRKIAGQIMDDSKGMTLSAISWDRTGTTRRWTMLQQTLDAAFLITRFEKGHCKASYDREVIRYSLNQHNKSAMTYHANARTGASAK